MKPQKRAKRLSFMRYMSFFAPTRFIETLWRNDAHSQPQRGAIRQPGATPWVIVPQGIPSPEGAFQPGSKGIEDRKIARQKNGGRLLHGFPRLARTATLRSGECGVRNGARLCCPPKPWRRRTIQPQQRPTINSRPFASKPVRIQRKVAGADARRRYGMGMTGFASSSFPCHSFP
jgi:hypothetical protein